jgi:cytochrome c peroxidase
MACLVALSVAFLALLASSPTRAQTSPTSKIAVEFSAEERARIAAHGPWPMPRSVDAGNRADAQADAIELGSRLFIDKRLSANNKLACASCHDPKRAFQDGKKSGRHGRNTPSLVDAAQSRWLGWDGATDSLWAASLAPLTAPHEMAATPRTLMNLLQRDRTMKLKYQAVFGTAKPDAWLLINTAKALAAYQATLTSPRTAFDDFADALTRSDSASSARSDSTNSARSDSTAASRYPQDAQRGLKLFVGEGRCFLCHTGPSFSNGEFADIGRPFFTKAGVDPGRWGGLQKLLASPFNRLGSYSDTEPDDISARATQHVIQEPRHYGEFKVPSLRGLRHTAPYFHDGSAASIEDVVLHYSNIDENRLHADGAQLLRPLKLTSQQVADLAAFLRTLSAP